MEQNQIVSRNAWLDARKALLVEEKKFSKLRDQLSAERRRLPWVKVEASYVFEGQDGTETLDQLFAGRSQLIVYHFMLGPAWQEGCPACSFLADHFDGAMVHLEQRDVTFVAVSRAPLPEIEIFQERMKWRFKWVSSHGTDFNRDYYVSFTQDEMAKEQAYYNYSKGKFPSEEGSGASVFYRDEAGNVFHTYSTYARGLDILIGAYNYLDLVPKGRDEAALPWSMSWLRHHDRYES